MGLLDALGYGSNPFVSFLDQNRQGLVGGFQGLANASPNDPRGLLTGAVNGVVSGSQSDYQRNLAANQLALQVQQRNAAADWLAKSGHPELAGAVRTGAVTGTDAFNQLNKQTVVPPGSSVIDGMGNTSTPGGNSGFYGGDLKSQAWNTVMLANAPNADPSLKQDPKFNAAWAIVTEPTMTPQGMMQPSVPPTWGPGAAGPAQTASVAPPPASAASPTGVAPIGMGSDVAPIGSMRGAPQGGSSFPNLNPTPAPVRGPGVIEGTQPFNESQARTTLLTQSAIPDIKRVISGFPALMNLQDQVLQKVSQYDPTGLARAAQSPDYKQAADAMTNSMVNMLYVASGANLNKDEWTRKAGGYLPVFGDDPQTAVNKLDRFANDLMSLAVQSKDPTTVAWARQAVSGIQQTEQQILSGKQQQAPVVDLGNGVTIQEVSP